MGRLLISGIGGSPKAADDSATCRAVRICAPGRFLRGNEESVERRRLGRRGLCRAVGKGVDRISTEAAGGGDGGGVGGGGVGGGEAGRNETAERTKAERRKEKATSTWSAAGCQR